MAIPLPQELVTHIDDTLSMSMFGYGALSVQSKSSTALQVAWVPTHCQHPSNHRRIMQVKTIFRNYCNKGLNMQSLACRMCRSHDVAWCSEKQTGPSMLEQYGYGVVTSVFGYDHYMYVAEWRPVSQAKQSVDLLIIDKRDMCKWAVQFDGDQHAQQKGADAVWDEMLLHGVCKYIVRLHDRDRPLWITTLEHARDRRHDRYFRTPHTL